MALVKVKPTSAGRRSLVKVVNPSLHKGAPVASLVEPQKRGIGPQQQRPHHGPPQGRRPQAALPVVDFKRNKDGVPAKVERLEYDPNRSANLALLLYVDGERRYIIAPRGVAVGTELMSGVDAGIEPGNCLPLRNIPVGTTVHCVEMQQGRGAQIARSAGASVQLLAREGIFAQLRLRSGEIRKVHVDCRAVIGEVGNEEHNLRSIGEAGGYALARHPPDRARHRDEPGRPPNGRAHQRRRRTAPPDVAVGHAGQGLQDAQEQAYRPA